MNKEVAIELLRDDNEYYGGIGKNYLSNSDIDSLLNNPKMFGVPRPDSKHFHDGRYFHQSILEPEKAKLTPFVEASSRNTNLYKDFIKATGIPFCMLKNEMDVIDVLVSTIKSNIYFFDEIYKDGNLYEEPAIGDIKGMMWKGKADIVTSDYIIDLKTTGDILKFKYSAKAYNYDSQAYIYQQLFGKPLVFFVIDKTTQQLGIFRPTESFIKGGEFKVEKAIEVYNKFFTEESEYSIDDYFISDILE
jgi:hypothetical protein